MTHSADKHRLTLYYILWIPGCNPEAVNVQLGGKVAQGQIFLSKFSVLPVSCHSSNTPNICLLGMIAFEMTPPVIRTHLIAKTRQIVLCT